MNNVTKT